MTLAFSSNDNVETTLSSNEAIKVDFPYSIYLSVVSGIRDFTPTSFEIYYWFEDRDASSLSDEEKAASVQLVIQKEVLEKEEVIYK